MLNLKRSVVDVDELGGAEQVFRRSELRASLLKPLTAIRIYWHRILENPRSRRPPLVTFATLSAMIAVHYATDQGANAWSYTVAGPWYSAIAAMFSHVSFEHLWINVVMLLL